MKLGKTGANLSGFPRLINYFGANTGIPIIGQRK